VAESIKGLEEELKYLFDKCLDQEFCRSYKCHTWNERDLLPLIRFYLAGVYGDDVIPEYWVRHALAEYGEGRVDFLVGETAVEIAVQPAQGHPNRLSRPVNEDECGKLMQHDGPAALALFDFSRVRSLKPEQLQSYRDIPSLGRGNYRKSGFNVLYFHRTGKSTVCERINVRC
jgi:hypothetical protein